MKLVFDNAKIIVEDRNNGVEPAITVIENNTVYIITSEPNGNWLISNEGAVGYRYDSDGKYIEDSNRLQYYNPSNK